MRPYPFVVPFGVVVLAAFRPTWEWATSGLENGLSAAWLGAVMLVLATIARRIRRATRPSPPISTARLVGAAFLLGLGPLVRPDLTVMAAVAIVVVLVMRRPRGASLAWFLAGALALPVVAELLSMGYYGLLVPNTALAKDSGGTYWSDG